MSVLHGGVRLCARRLVPSIAVLAGLLAAAPAHAAPTAVDDNTIGTSTNQFLYNNSANWTYEQRGDSYQGGDHYDKVANDYYKVSFSGTQVQIYGAKDYGLGIMGVSIDGGAETPVDEYAPTRATQKLLYTSPTLSAATHTLKVRVTGTKNASATNYFVAADEVVITPASTSSQSVIKSFDFETTGSRFDGRNGSVTYTNSRSYSGSYSALTPMVTQTINRGWMWQSSTGDYCAGSGFPGDVTNTFAPVGSVRDIKGEFYVTNTSVTGERLVALSYDPSCLTSHGAGSGNHSSIIELILTNGHVNMEASSYGISPQVTLGDTAQLAFPANQWVAVDEKIGIARDGSGFMQLTINGTSTPVVYGPTMQTSYGNYNEVQRGSGWCESNCSGNVYVDDATLLTN